MSANSLLDVVGIFETAVARGQNPYSELRSRINSLVAPYTSDAFNAQLQVLRALCGVIFALEFMTLVVKLRRGSWALFRLRHTRSGVFVVPTALSWLVLFLIFLPCIIAALSLTDQVYRLRRLDLIPATSWWNITSYIPLYCGAWTATWNLAVSALAPTDSIESSRLVRTHGLAIALNILGFCIPLGLVATILPFYIRAQLAITRASASYQVLDSELAAAATSSPRTLAGLLPIVPEAAKFAAATQDYMDQVHLGDAIWVFWMAQLVILISLFAVLQVRRSRAHIASLSRHRFVVPEPTTASDVAPKLFIASTHSGPSSNVNRLTSRLRLVIAEAVMLVTCAIAFLIVLAFKVANEQKSLTDRATLEGIRLSIFWAFTGPNVVLAALLFASCFTDALSPSSQAASSTRRPSAITQLSRIEAQHWTADIEQPTSFSYAETEKKSPSGQSFELSK